eukprot:CAMPEP_0197387542 /NCGR_PEP_ID=MMETSP1165-20131217/587_1 /TAXON_ID=284809 /ORGANISM="Chrysocystis fragilis, Strain CCMP3189" /LENGTH=470 /DNA_ID=CAMNT_0042912869 /DNA_START=258 /DNA_END=1670 /DNA_ORIENTATION=-
MNWQQQQQQQQQQAYNQMYFQQYGYPGALPAAAPRGQAMGMYPGMMMPPAMGYAPVTVTQQQPTAAPRVQEQQVVVAEGSSQLANVPMNVFVGKLPLSIDDSFVAHLLKQCGPVLKWKRATEAETDKPKAFGFCTFASAHGAMQAVRVLNDLPVMGDQKILVKVGKKEQAIIDSLRRGPQLSASELALLETLRRLVASHDPRAPVREGESLQPAPTSAEIDPAIVEEMAKFRSKQAQRDRELEEERRRKLQARIHEAKDEEAAKLLAQRPAKKAKPAEQPVLSHEEPTHMAQTTAKLGFGLSKHAAAKKTPLPQKPALFAPDEAKTPRPLKRLDDDDDDDDDDNGNGGEKPRDAPRADDDDARAKKIAETIPTDKTQLFAMALDWDTIEAKRLVRAKLRPWIAKRMHEYLGADEPTLTDFVATQLDHRADPDAIATELALVLDDDAHTFVHNLWRVLHFHAKKATADSGS